MQSRKIIEFFFVLLNVFEKRCCSIGRTRSLRIVFVNKTLLPSRSASPANFQGFRQEKNDSPILSAKRTCKSSLVANASTCPIMRFFLF